MFAICLATIVATESASAEPVSIAALRAYGGELAVVDLLANPGAVLTGQQVDFGGFTKPVVVFNVEPSGLPSGPLSVTLTLPPGSDPPLANNPQILPAVSQAVIYSFAFDFPTFYTPQPMSLTFDVVGDPTGITGPNTFTFSVVQPVPEPATLLLVGIGAAGLVVRQRRRQQGRESVSTG